MFDYRSQLMIYLIGIFLVLKWPLKGKYREYAMNSVLAYASLFVAEIGLYLWFGNDSWSESHYYYFIGAYTLFLYWAAIKEKLWN